MFPSQASVLAGTRRLLYMIVVASVLIGSKRTVGGVLFGSKWETKEI